MAFILETSNLDKRKSFSTSDLSALEKGYYSLPKNLIQKDLAKSTVHEGDKLQPDQSNINELFTELTKIVNSKTGCKFNLKQSTRDKASNLIHQIASNIPFPMIYNLGSLPQTPKMNPSAFLDSQKSSPLKEKESETKFYAKKVSSKATQTSVCNSVEEIQTKVLQDKQNKASQKSPARVVDARPSSKGDGPNFTYSSMLKKNLSQQQKTKTPTLSISPSDSSAPPARNIFAKEFKFVPLKPRAIKSSNNNGIKVVSNYEEDELF